MRILRSMRPEHVEFRAKARNHCPGLIVIVPDDLSLHWVERMVGHALQDANLNPETGQLTTLD
jgi:hypothetical protein